MYISLFYRLWAQLRPSDREWTSSAYKLIWAPKGMCLSLMGRSHHSKLMERNLSCSQQTHTPPPPRPTPPLLEIKQELNNEWLACISNKATLRHMISQTAGVFARMTQKHFNILWDFQWNTAVGVISILCSWNILAYSSIKVLESVLCYTCNGTWEWTRSST